ncbi:MAG: type IV secretion system DNA-binding domain-containing protein [Deferribacteres bacterium]|nr:type IV secretion system DNA-binding domain-containing protein [Deferribacteres bacterium]
MPSTNSQDITILGETTFRNDHKIFGIKQADRRYHMHILGKTGMGKTTLLENMLISDIEYGRGCALIDPHGDLAESLLDRIPKRRTNDVIYFNPADTQHPIAMNILEKVPSDQRALLAVSVLSIFKKLYSEFWGSRMEYVFRNALLTATQLERANLRTVVDLLTNLNFREAIIPKLTDRALIKFWQKEFATFDKRQRTEVIFPIINKVGQFLTNPFISPIIDTYKNKVDFRRVIDQNQILIANLSKGKISEDAMMLLGAILITKIQLAALSRSDIPEKDRTDFHLYIDECQNFLSENFANLFAEMRKYRLNLVLANQHFGQLETSIQQSILGNIGSLLCFRLGVFDAELMQKEFYPYVNSKNLIELPKYHIFLKLMIDGVASRVFSAKTLRLDDKLHLQKNKITKVSQARYSRNGMFI